MQWRRRRLASRLSGVDIDADNIEWCKRNISFASFATVPLRPPTPLETGRYGLIVGVSVFTLLGKSDQDRWLDELARIAAPCSR